MEWCGHMLDIIVVMACAKHGRDRLTLRNTSRSYVWHNKRHQPRYDIYTVNGRFWFVEQESDVCWTLLGFCMIDRIRNLIDQRLHVTATYRLSATYRIFLFSHVWLNNGCQNCATVCASSTSFGAPRAEHACSGLLTRCVIYRLVWCWVGLVDRSMNWWWSRDHRAISRSACNCTRVGWSRWTVTTV